MNAVLYVNSFTHEGNPIYSFYVSLQIKRECFKFVFHSSRRWLDAKFNKAEHNRLEKCCEKTTTLNAYWVTPICLRGISPRASGRCIYSEQRRLPMSNGVSLPALLSRHSSKPKHFFFSWHAPGFTQYC